MDLLDTIVIGAGPAGLTAAIYLARFRRSVVVFSAGPPRASWIPESHNTPGFPHGVGGPELLRRLGEQAAQFGVDTRNARVDGLSHDGQCFTASAGGAVLRARTVLVATGVVDRMPAIEGLDEAIRRSLVRMCPICDAYEAIEQRLAVLGDGPSAEREAAFLRTYADDIAVIGEREGRVTLERDAVVWTATDGRRRVFDHLYLALGCETQVGLALACGAACDENGDLLVDAHQMTTVPGLYAAGDVVRGLNQIAVANGEAAIAATAIHNRLRGA